MSEPFYVCRGATGNWSYLSNNYGWCKHFSEAKAFINRDAALTILRACLKKEKRIKHLN